MRRQGSQVSMRVARGSASWHSSHGKGLGPRDALSAFPLGWPWEAQSSPRVARESWGLRSSHCRAEETSPRRVSGT